MPATLHLRMASTSADPMDTQVCRQLAASVALTVVTHEMHELS